MNKLIFFPFGIEDVKAIIKDAVLKAWLEKEAKRSAPDYLMTREEAAKYLKINLSTLHLWTKAGRIPAHAIAKRVYYKRSEIDNSLKRINK